MIEDTDYNYVNNLIKTITFVDYNIVQVDTQIRNKCRNPNQSVHLVDWKIVTVLTCFLIETSHIWCSEVVPIFGEFHRQVTDQKLQVEGPVVAI